MIIIVDDEDRENEGDLMVAAEKITPEIVNFMATPRPRPHLPAAHPRAARGAPAPPHGHARTRPASRRPSPSRSTPSEGVTTGISAHDRARTILAAVDPATKPDDLARPGHIFPLQAVEGGVLSRAGQTEAAVDLARMAGLVPAGVICEVMNEDGSMARRAPARGDQPAVRHPDPDHRRAHPLPHASRDARPQARGDGPADVARPFPHPRLRGHDPRRPPRRPRQGRRRRRRAGPRPGPFAVPDGRHVRLGPLRLRRPAPPVDGDDREGRPGRRPLHPEPRGPGHRAGQQDPGLRHAGQGGRHGRGQPPARLQARPARLRHRRPDPGRPRRPPAPPPHEQPAEVRRPVRIRAGDRRARARSKCRPNACNLRYLKTKKEKMGHILDLV